MQSAQNSSWHIVSAIYIHTYIIYIYIYIFVLLLLFIIITATTSIRNYTLPFSVGEIETRNWNNFSELHNVCYKFLF